MVVSAATAAGYPVPGLSASLGWFDTLTTASGSANVIQGHLTSVDDEGPGDRLTRDSLQPGPFQLVVIERQGGFVVLGEVLDLVEALA